LAVASPERLLGYGSILLAAILLGVAGALAKVLFQADVDPLDLTALRSILATLVFLGALAFLDRDALRLPRRQIAVVVVGGLAFAAVNVTFYLAISLITVAAAITLEYTAPIFVLAIGLVARTHQPDIRATILAVLAVIGCLMLTGSTDRLFSLETGVLVGLACGFSFAVYNMVGNASHARGVPTNRMTLYCFLVSSILWLCALPFLGVHEIAYTSKTVVYVLFIAIVATVLPYWLLVHGLSRVDALPATVIGMLDPIAAGVFAYFLVDERLTPLNMIGIAIILAAAAALSRHIEKIARAKGDAASPVAGPIGTPAPDAPHREP